MKVNHRVFARCRGKHSFRHSQNKNMIELTADDSVRLVKCNTAPGRMHDGVKCLEDLGKLMSKCWKIYVGSIIRGLKFIERAAKIIVSDQFSRVQRGTLANCR